MKVHAIQLQERGRAEAAWTLAPVACGEAGIVVAGKPVVDPHDGHIWISGDGLQAAEEVVQLVEDNAVPAAPGALIS